MASIEIATIMSAYPYKRKDTLRKTSGSFSNQFFKDVKEGFNKIPALKIKNRCNYDKLKYFLKLSSKRLQTEILSKADVILRYRNRVVIHMKHKDVELAMPLVVQIERQGQMREAMVNVRKYCNVLLERFILLQTVKSLDANSAEAVSSILWASQRLALEELRHVAEQLTNKYGKCYAEACKKKQVATINEQLVSQISVSTASKDVIERILLDIAKEYKIEYIPKNKDCHKKQVLTIQEQLVNQFFSPTTSKDLVVNNLLEFFEEYKDDNIHDKDMSAIDDLLNTKLDKEVGLNVDEPLVLENCSTTPLGVSQLDIPNARCQAPSPGGSCLATSPGGTKIWCNFDVSPAKKEISNPLKPIGVSQLDIPNARCQAPSPGGSCLATSPGGTKIWCNFDISPAQKQTLNPLTPIGVSQLDIPNGRCQAPSPGGSCRATSPGGTKIWCNFDISPAKKQILNPLCPHKITDLASNITDLASSPFSLNSGSISRSNPIMDDNNYLLDMDMSKRELGIKVTNPFKELMSHDDAKALSPFQHDLFEVDVPDNESSSRKSKNLNSPFRRPKATNPTKYHGVDVPDNESSSRKSKHVDPELLFQLDIEDKLYYV